MRNLIERSIKLLVAHAGKWRNSVSFEIRNLFTFKILTRSQSFSKGIIWTLLHNSSFWFFWFAIFWCKHIFDIILFHIFKILWQEPILFKSILWWLGLWFAKRNSTIHLNFFINILLWWFGFLIKYFRLALFTNLSWIIFSLTFKNYFIRCWGCR